MCGDESARPAYNDREILPPFLQNALPTALGNRFAGERHAARIPCSTSFFKGGNQAGCGSCKPRRNYCRAEIVGALARGFVCLCCAWCDSLVSNSVLAVVRSICAHVAHACNAERHLARVFRRFRPVGVTGAGVSLLLKTLSSRRTTTRVAPGRQYLYLARRRQPIQDQAH